MGMDGECVFGWRLDTLLSKSVMLVLCRVMLRSVILHDTTRGGWKIMDLKTDMRLVRVDRNQDQKSR